MHTHGRTHQVLSSPLLQLRIHELLVLLKQAQHLRPECGIGGIQQVDLDESGEKDALGLGAGQVEGFIQQLELVQGGNLSGDQPAKLSQDVTGGTDQALHVHTCTTSTPMNTDGIYMTKTPIAY